MSENGEQRNDIPERDGPERDGVVTSRRTLMLGAVGASAIVSIRPALAATAVSIVHCQIPVPDAARTGGWIAPDGTVVPSGTAGAFAPPRQPLKGEDVKHALAGGQLPGVEYERSQAYMKYVRNLHSGASGFTCFASLQMPRG
ncbi:hypothetical protein [Sphingomonas sp. NFR15]|uniref:hypothetical protein n=1 Tax=Sphingomonas sp. NFR15 TaxID=1566282 RepID=UPI0008898F26|nr:hypothetical protein [Sphingomonas sp. NFR15]SDA13626.1 hypothetical protein SAMN03159340_00435 [Sphingomonas sp. NFR15]